MAARILDGNKIRDAIKAELADQIRDLKSADITPGLAAVLVGENPDISQTELCARLSIKKANIVPLVAGLETRGLLQRAPDAPADLRDHAVVLAGNLLAMGGAAQDGDGHTLAAHILSSGQAWHKFQAICEAQGGMRTPPVAGHRRAMVADRPGMIDRIDTLEATVRRLQPRGAQTRQPAVAGAEPTPLPIAALAASAGRPDAAWNKRMKGNLR